ncbi:unnamed protein product [Cochlearia groenlandica]
MWCRNCHVSSLGDEIFFSLWSKKQILRHIRRCRFFTASDLADVSKKRSVQWVFLGFPGVGKGTYASRLSSLLCVPHIATGDIVHEELASSGPLSHQSQPREEYYRSKGKLMEFDLRGGIPESWPRLLESFKA